MSAEELTAKYILAMEKVLSQIQKTKGPITISEECINEVFNYVHSYLADAKYFQSQKKHETSLVSIAYCEGLLDALKLIGAAKNFPPLK
ncbi:MAG: DUF357 domain-containing protein [Crenarchaeota archaeon]|nr:DUF357 domain-containing protein [Thermoproteota archaeon]